MGLKEGELKPVGFIVVLGANRGRLGQSAHVEKLGVQGAADGVYTTLDESILRSG